MVTASLGFRVRPHKRAEVLSAMDVLVERMRDEPGCLRSRLWCDVEDQTAFTLASEWRDLQAADAFFESREFRLFRGMRILLRDEPSIVLDDVHGRVTRLFKSN